jgi:hypothetical protein
MVEVKTGSGERSSNSEPGKTKDLEVLEAQRVKREARSMTEGQKHTRRR